MFDVGSSMLDVQPVQCSTCPQCLETGVRPIQPFHLYIHVYTNPWNYAWQAGVHPYIGLATLPTLVVNIRLIRSG
jgi:hypothetical protein